MTKASFYRNATSVKVKFHFTVYGKLENTKCTECRVLRKNISKYLALN